MRKLPNHIPMLLAVTLLAAGLILAGCGLIPDSSQNAAAGPITPTPTADSAGYRSVDSRACLVSDFTSMQSSGSHGDLVAWQPGSENLAYLAPSGRSSWYIGDLVLVKAPDYTEHVQLAPGVLATGDLTWSPSGDHLAFLAFRPNENVYTVMTVRADGSGLTDLFPTDLARSDSRTSQKAIIAWKDDTTIEVMAACGEECRNAYDIKITGATTGTGATIVPTPIADYTLLNGALQMSRREIKYEAKDYPKAMRLPDWSPDDAWVVYLDRRGLLLGASHTDKITFPIDIGLRDVTETQWSTDSRQLAVRAEDRIFIFQIPCTPPAK